MARELHDFVVTNQGHCFICFKPSQFSQSEEQDDSYPVYSLQSLSRYLNLDIRKALVEDGLIPPGLLAKVTVSKLKVELCEPCASMNENFSELFRQFEKAKMGLTSALRDIFAKLDKAETNEAAAEHRIFLKTGSFGLEKLKIVKALRDETMQKCSKELGALVPTVRVENLSLEQVDKEKLKMKNDFHMKKSQWLAITGLKKETFPEPVYDSDNFEDPFIDVGDVKLEPNADYDNEFCNSDKDNSGGDSSKNISLLKSCNIGLTSLRKKCISNPKTGKHKCRECSKELSSITAFYQHYRSQHLKFRYRCSVCGRKFCQVGNFNRHQRQDHKDAKFKCRVCNQVFALESNLLKHRRANTCADKESVEKSGLVIVRPSKVRPKHGALQKLCSTDSTTGKLKCSLCPEEFQVMSSFRRHYNSDHLKVKYRCTLCQQEFTSRAKYDYHHARQHLNEKFKCTQCSKIFQIKSDLRAHFRRKHFSKLPKYSCNVCSQTFHLKGQLFLHQRTSSSCKVKVKKPKNPTKGPETLVIIRPESTPEEGGELYEVDSTSGKYLCKICSKEFANSRSFQIHHKSVHLKIRYRCTLCLKEFTFRSGYDAHHKNVHMDTNRSKCEDCHKLFRGRSSLWKHRQKNCRGRGSRDTIDLQDYLKIEMG